MTAADDMFTAALDGAGPDLAKFFTVSRDLLCIRDREFRFVRVNQAWELALGYRVEELEGQKMAPFIHPEDMPASLEHMQRLEVEDEVVGFINRYRHRDGSYRQLEWRARRSGDHVYGVARDVTERLELQAQMAAAHAAAEAANRAKSDFLANMSHEIRTPLNGVIGIASALARTDLTAEQRDMLGMILSSGSTLERLVSDVLDFSKIEAGRLEIEARPFDLRAELGDLLEVFRGQALAKGLDFPIAYGDAAKGQFVGDAVRLKQVVGNLLSNAVKFTAQGQVSISITLDEPSAGPANLLLEVRDTGVGFPPDFAAALFQRFRQAGSSRFGGAGLGLSITRALVEMMGGEIEAASTLGQGSAFRVSLPLARAPAREAHAPAAPEAHPPRSLSTLRVLLAEDHPINQRVVELILAPYEVALTIVDDGAQALAAHAASRFDLVLMDMQMPVMDGLAATRAIRERERETGAHIPIVMLSANAMTQHRQDAADAGADHHLAKPITAAALIQALDIALPL